VRQASRSLSALLAGATREFAHVMVIDTPVGFRSMDAASYSPELARLTVVRAPALDLAGEAAAALAKAGAGFILLMGRSRSIGLDHSSRPPTAQGPC